MTLCSAVVFASSSSVYTNEPFQIGSRSMAACPADELVIKKDVRAHNSLGIGKLFDKSFEKIETFTPGNGKRITMIKATNLKKNGATVQLISGGIGQLSTKLKFENKNHGFHYVVEIYASKNL